MKLFKRKFVRVDGVVKVDKRFGIQYSVNGLKKLRELYFKNDEMLVKYPQNSRYLEVEKALTALDGKIRKGLGVRDYRCKNGNDKGCESCDGYEIKGKRRRKCKLFKYSRGYKGKKVVYGTGFDYLFNNEFSKKYCLTNCTTDGIIHCKVESNVGGENSFHDYEGVGEDELD